MSAMEHKREKLARAKEHKSVNEKRKRSRSERIKTERVFYRLKESRDHGKGSAGGAHPGGEKHI